MLLVWNSSLLTGNSLIDQQHQELYKQANVLLDALSKGKGKDEIGEIIKFAEAYTMQHFKDEEAILRRCGYPKLAEHVKEHQAFKEEFTRLKKRFEAEGPNASLAIEINQKVAKWLRDHVSGSDQDYAKYVKAA